MERLDKLLCCAGNASLWRQNEGACHECEALSLRSNTLGLASAKQVYEFTVYMWYSKQGNLHTFGRMHCACTVLDKSCQVAFLRHCVSPVPVPHP